MIIYLSVIKNILIQFKKSDNFQIFLSPIFNLEYTSFEINTTIYGKLYFNTLVLVKLY